MRVDIRINGESIDLKPRSSFELQLNNPAAGYEGITGARAVNLQVMNTQRNRNIMGVSQDPRWGRNMDMMRAEVYAGGDLINYGACYLRDLSDGLDIDYTSGLADFYGRWQQVKLSEMAELGSLEVPSTWNATVGHTWEVGGYVLPTVHNPAFFKDAPAGWDERMNSYAGSYVVSSPKVPMFFLKYVLKKVGELAGVKHAGPFWDDAGGLVIFNTARPDPASIEVRRHLPDMTVGELLLACRRAFNLYLAFDNKTKTLGIYYADTLRRHAPSQDWSDRIPRLRGGKPERVDELVFAYAGDSNDNSAKDDFFAPVTVSSGTGQIARELRGNMMPLQLKAGLPYTLTPEREEGREQRVLRLLSWSGSPLTSGNAFKGAVMNYAGLLEDFWKKTVAIEADSYTVETTAALTAADVAWLAGSFSGSGEPPVVHAQGVNWEVLQAVVAFGESRISGLKMRRV